MLHYLNENSDHCTCSQEQVEEYLATYFSTINQSEPLKSKITPAEFCLPGSETAFCHDSQSGMTYAPSTADHGAEEWTSSPADSHVRIFPPQGKAQESKEQDQVCGNIWRELSVKYDRDTHSWRTHRCLWEEDLQPSLLTLPKWGMMQSGELSERTTPGHLTSETESGFLLPTPTCADATMGAILNDNTKLITLKSGRLRKISNQGISGSIGLARTIAIYPTPTCHNAKECDAPAESTRNTPTLCHIARGGDQTQPKHLNPTWVEWLMGWPLEWTGLKPLGMARFRQWLHLHGKL